MLAAIEEALTVASYQLVEGFLHKHERLVVLAQALLQDVRDDVQVPSVRGLV